ncbi:hypothetical protein [Streptomyces sp. 4F14]|uniref:hypothetical protein n=1 Tax=Streptomyces sp. 4F14 TaxID=3394380 RepID=UPI003A871CBF
MSDQNEEIPDLDPVLKTGASPRNIQAATKAISRIRGLGWEPLAPYPGSDTHWKVRCLLGCDGGENWQGVMYYSHMRRARRHRGCHPKELREAAIKALNEARS